MRYELIVFDWDGTLMDSAAKIVQCFERAFADASVPSPGDSAIRRIIGLGLTEAVRELMPTGSDIARRAVTDGYRQYFIGLDAGETQLFPGVRDGLAKLVARGYQLAIATGKSRRGLDRVLGQTGLGDLFVSTRCADEAFSKPHPRMLEDILEYTGVPPHQSVMIGDTTYDLLMARAAGVHGVAVSYGVHGRDELLAHGALACCNSFDEICEWIHSVPNENSSVPATRF
jgi:phosphoglycolate phosphatase